MIRVVRRVTGRPVSQATAIPVQAIDATVGAQPVEGAAAQPVYVVSDAELASGAFIVSGEASLAVVEVDGNWPVAGGPALPVYLRSGSFSPAYSPVIELPRVVSASLLLNLQADRGVLQAGGAVSRWADQSGNGHDFKQVTAGARPTVKTQGGLPAIQFDGIDDFLVGPNFADNLDSFAVFAVGYDDNAGQGGFLISKGGIYSTGWAFANDIELYASSDEDGNNYLGAYLTPPSHNVQTLVTGEFLSRTMINLYLNGVLQVPSPDVSGTLGDFTVDAPVVIGRSRFYSNLDFSVYMGYIQAVLLYQILDVTVWATDRPLIENWLKAKWGL